MVNWGGTVGHLEVGIEVSTDGIATWTTATNVYIDFYVRTVGWGADDDQTMVAQVNGGTWTTFSYHLSSPSGTSTEQYIGRVTIANQGLSYGGGPNYTFHGYVGGSNLGANPWHGINWSLPARPSTTPSAPGASHSNVTSNSATINLSPSYSDGGNAIFEYSSWILTNNAEPDAGGNVVSGADGMSHTAYGLARATLYYYTARARNGNGYSPFTPMGYFYTAATVPDQQAPPTVSGVGSSSATVTWAAPNNGGSAIDLYELQISTDGGFGSNVYDQYTNSGVQVSGLNRFTTYYARTRSHNGVNWSAWSGGTAFTTAATAPDAPTNLAVSNIQPDSAVLTWTAGGNGGSALTSWGVQIALDDAFTSGLRTFADGSLTGLTPGIQYFARVRGGNALGSGGWSSVVSFTTLSGAKVKINGAWVTAKVWVKVEGSWRLAKVWKKVNGTWIV